MEYLQIQKVVLALGDYMNVSCHACIGGTNLREDMRRLEMGVQIIVGTPGRVYDMINRRVLGKSGRMVFSVKGSNWICLEILLELLFVTTQK